MVTHFWAERSDRPLTAELRIYMLGPPSIETTSGALDIPRRQVRALLYYLATCPNPTPRQHLYGLFWPDIPEGPAHRNLSHLLTHLRRILPTPKILRISDDHITLDPQRAWSDLIAFERLCLTLLESPHRLAAVQQALALYRGPFLEGFSLPTKPEFELWLTQERSFWEQRYLEALAALVETQVAAGHYHAAIESAQCYLATDELAEAMHRRLMTLYAAVGERNAAVRQFEQCAVVLERELGVSPLPETRATYRAILAGQVIAWQPPASPSPEWATLPSLEVPMVGREAALQQLEQAYRYVQAGHGRLILISGESGIGKSRLLQEFVTQLDGPATVVIGMGRENERDFPYWPLVQALGPHLPGLDPTRPGFEPFYLAPLAGLWPELQRVVAESPSLTTRESDQEGSLMFQALVHLLLNLATQRSPLILGLDDLHWVDRHTLACLESLARQLKHAPLLIVATYRTEEAAGLATVRAELARFGLLQEIRLVGLLPFEIEHLLHHLSKQRRGVAPFSRYLHRETGGNPFFLLELLRFLFESGLLGPEEADWAFTEVAETPADTPTLPLPDTVCEVIRARLGCLNPQTQQVLEACAVIGHEFNFDLIRATSGRLESEVVEALETLLARQLITEHVGQYRFNHDLIRTVICRDLSYGRRRLLHRRIGEALKNLDANQVTALAWHFERAEEPGQAARYALQAGRSAKAVFAYAEACAQFDHALALLKEEATHLRKAEALRANWWLQVQILTERDRLFRLLGDMAAYALGTAEMAQLAGQLGDPRTLALLHWREAYTQRWFCHYAEAHHAAEDGLRLSKAADPLLEAMCRREVGLAARETGDYLSARANLEQAAQSFVALGEWIYEIHTLGNLSTLHCRLGEFERAINLARQALHRCDESRLPFERRLPLGDLGAAAITSGDKDLARQYLLESLAIARQIADRTQEIFCLGHLGWLCLRLKQPVEALEFLQTALTLAENVGSATEQSWLWSGLAEAHRLDGNPELAVELAQQALKLAQVSGRAYDQTLAGRILAELGQTDFVAVL